MQWLNTIREIVCLNLLHREDRLLDFTAQMEEYNIPFRRINAIHNKERGAAGLRDTLVKLFNEEIEKITEHILVFEDDAEIVVPDSIFHDSMNKVVEQLPENYHICFLGCQITANGCTFNSPNLIRVIKAFSTHAVIWSLQGMKEAISMGLDYPIDNDMVERLEPMGHSYCTYPFLCSQRAGHSDIYNNFIDWKPFLDMRYTQRVNEIRR